MERPILNPSVFDDPDRRPLASTEREPWMAGRFLGQIARGAWQAVRGLWKLLWTPLIPRRVSPDGVDRRNLLIRSVAPAIFRLMFLAVLLLGTVVLIVHLMTHPPVSNALGAPVTGSVHAEALTIPALDGILLDAYLAPAIDEKRVLINGDVAVRAKWPAVVLVPDQRGDGHELDKLIGSLHDRGYVVLLLRLRGSGKTDCAQTLGLHEKHDVAAAVAYVRQLKYVDTPRISIIATGTGATASMLARRDDRNIEHVIVYQPVPSFDAVLTDAVSAPWLRPACRWAFEVIHRVDAEEMDRDLLLHELKGGVLLLANHPSRAPQQQMIARYLQTDPQVISAAR